MAAKQYELTITCQFCQKYRSTVCLQSADFERDSSITNQKSSTSVYSREPMLCSAHSLSIFVIPLFLSRTTETLISPHAPVCTSPVQVELCTPSCAKPPPALADSQSCKVFRVPAVPAPVADCRRPARSAGCLRCPRCSRCNGGEGSKGCRFVC